MSAKSLVEISKKNWTSESNTWDAINCGSLKRIADACELMSRSYASVILERDQYRGWYDESKKRCRRLERSNASLRGHLRRKTQ